ncbi:MAG: M50 family metallopeptidase [Gemmatimonadota bacterium]|jgi:hypothetical protein
MNDVTRRKLRFLAGFAVYFGALWFLWNTPVVYPLKIFVVLLHETSHALMAVATGGAIQRIVLDPYQGGATYTVGGNAFLTLSAGYLGSLGWGALMVEAARAKRVRSDLVIGLIGGLVVALTVLFVRSTFGVVFGIVFGAALVAAARKLSVAVNRSLLLTLGLTSSLYAILDIKSDILDRPHLQSDAFLLGRMTGVPTLAWGILWIVVALGVSALLFRRAWRSA